jgi:hypothetical protein
MDRNDGGPAVDLSAYDASTLMRWYATFNSWKVPEDMPAGVVEPEYCSAPDYRERFPKQQKFWRALCRHLTEQQQSWGWWRDQKIGDFEEWSDWWPTSSRGTPRRVTINENGELLDVLAERAKERTP